jgi:hypothetical protein
MWLRNAQRACCHVRPVVDISKRWAGQAFPQRLPSPAFRQLGLLHSAGSASIRARSGAGDTGPNAVEEAEVEESETLKVLDALFDHVAGESESEADYCSPSLTKAHIPTDSADHNASNRSRSSPSIMRDLSASPWLSSLAQPGTHQSSKATLTQTEDKDTAKLDKPASKTMADSYTCFDLKLSQNPKTLERYLNTSGGLSECLSSI